MLRHGAMLARSRPGARWPRALLLLGALTVAGLLGCGDQGAHGNDSPGAGDDEPVSRSGGTSGPDMEWWQRQVPISILIAGGQRGHLKPCGCVTPQRGGLERMAAVQQQLRRRAEKAGGALASLGMGWTMRGNHEPQEEARADYVRGAYEVLGFSGLLLGASDLTVPAMCQPRGSGGVDVPHPPINVIAAATNPARATPAALDLEVGGLKVRALSVLDPDEAAALESSGAVMREMRMSITQALAGLDPRPDTLWMVSAFARDETTVDITRKALKRLGPGVVVDVSGAEHAPRRIDRKRLAAGDDALVVGLDEFGMTVGVLDLEPADVPGAWLVSYRSIDLVQQWEKYGGSLMQSVSGLHDLHREMLRDERYLFRHPRAPDVGATYVGSSACARCHPAIYNEWKKSPHAGALETLRDVGHAWDPDCVRCHVVGWARQGEDAWAVRKSGFRDPIKTAYLGGVGCESCHGPGSAHVAEPWSKAPFAADGPNRAKPGKQDTCVQCHDRENTNGFAAGYRSRLLPLVDHRRVPQDRRTVMPLTGGAGKGPRGQPGKDEPGKDGDK